MNTIWLSIVGVSGFLTVGLGAFAAHGLRGKISEPLLAAFQTATHYQMFHTLALFCLIVLIAQLTVVPKILWVAAYCWLAGMFLFSGSLYWLALGGPNWLSPITPMGGLLLMAAWFCLATGAWQLRL